MTWHRNRLESALTTRGRPPELLGSKVREGWREVADFNDHVIQVVLAGCTLQYRDQELTLHRHGRPEQVWTNLDCSPVFGETGQPEGVLCVLAETTDRIAAERQCEAAEAAEAALNLCPGLPILLATGYADLPSGERLALPRLGKPYTQDQLEAEIRKLLAH